MCVFRLAPAAATLALLAACSTSPGPASAPTAAAEPAGCPDTANIALQVNQYTALLPFPAPPPTLSMAAAACSQRKFVQALATRTGARVVGYKAGLTTPAMQQRFGVSHPLRGTLTDKMILKSGATVPAKFGALPFVESDLVVEVASADIMSATTPQQALASLRAVYPFIELPDRMYASPPAPAGAAAALIAANVGARLGVLGAPIDVRANPGIADAMRNMTVRLTDATGQVATGKGSDILGDPLASVVWLVADLKRAGITLKPGDLLSLGGFGAGAAAAGKSATVVYEGLPGNPSVTVNFQ